MNEKAVNSPVKHNPIEEYIGGSNAGNRTPSNRWHNLIVSNTAIALGSRLHGNKCDIYVSNMRVRLKNGQMIYPDVVMVNGEPAFADQRQDILLNPTVVVEVISPGTNSADRAHILESFLAVDSVREVLLVKEDEMRAEHYARQNAKQWIYRIYNERDDVISLESIGVKLSMSEIYAQIKFRHAQISSSAVN
jgi:Uma2 family endonuclease